MMVITFLIFACFTYIVFKIANNFIKLKVPANRDERTRFIITKSLSEVAIVLFSVDAFQGLINIVYSVIKPGSKISFPIHIGYGGENSTLSIYPIIFDIIIFFIFWQINKNKYGDI